LERFPTTRGVNQFDFHDREQTYYWVYNLPTGCGVFFG